MFLNKTYDIVIDRPLGSRHPKFKETIYPINYGFIPNTQAEDQEPVDVYVIDALEPLEKCNVRIIGIITRNDDNEKKLIGCISNKKFSKKEIIGIVKFQERYFDSYLEELIM
ncbi:MAG: inorganic pyrophosphatase [Bacteroidetes bacterium]|nr:inorganic pyrophosphatase [Bacteroidota bacterium]